MAINLEKFRPELLQAWKDVLNDKTDTDWALFGYDKLTNDLKVVGTGSGGLEELIEDFNSGKIMYAFAKINDPKTSLPKCVLINWQGEGANTVRKGICANHLRDVERFFSGANVTINARNEEEVEPQLIIDKIAKAGSVYSFKAPRGDNSGPTGPIGSNYKRVNPIKEINAVERDQFWMKEEQEEKKRVEEERKRRDVERLRLEEEARKRETIEAQVRDEKTKKRDNSIDLIKEAEKVALAHQVQENMDKFSMEDNESKVNQSDVLRQLRNEEAHNLIAQRTIDARSIFERNTSAGQMKRTPEKPVRTSILKAQQAQQQKIEEEIKQQEMEQKQPQPQAEIIQQVQTIEYKIPEEQQSDDDSDQFATIKRSPKDLEKKNSVTSPNSEQETVKNVINNQENNIPITKTETVQQITEQQLIDEVLYGDLGDSGIQARALYDYQAADDTEISFDPGDVITHIELVDEGWWQGLGPDGVYGLFPANYVELF